MTLDKSAHSLGLNFPKWETIFENLQSNFKINDFSLILLGVGKERKTACPACNAKGEWSGWTDSLEKGKAGSSSAVQCRVRALESRVQALGSEELRAGTGEDELGSGEGFLRRRRDLSRVLKHRYRLGKETSMRKEGSGS